MVDAERPTSLIGCIDISRSVVGKKDFQRIDPLFGDDMIVDQRVQLLQFKLVRQITLIEEAVAR
jgi:hypothetical protein